MTPPSEDAVRNVLRGVVDPELGMDIVELGMVRYVEVDAGGAVTVEIALTIAGCPLRSQIESDAVAMVSALPGVAGVTVTTGSMGATERSALMAKARRRAADTAEPTEVPDNTRILAVASGKGGVGKSSIAVNTAVALARRGLTVGLLDADIWGFSVPRMLGVAGALTARADRKIVPLTKQIGVGEAGGTEAGTLAGRRAGRTGDHAGVIKVVSMGFLAEEETAIMWRGLMLNKAVQQFLQDVAWGDMHYLLIDMPPGTGDVQMGLARMLPRAEVLIVTTPPLAAQKVASRAASMARKGYLRIAGVIENMSAFTCEHGTPYPLFGTGGGERLASEIGVPLVGSVPLDPSIASGGDQGSPVALDGSSPASRSFDQIAERIVTDIAPVIEMSGCSARMIDSLGKAVAT